MDPLTHVLVSVTLGRAGAAKISARAMPMLVVAGVAADLDWASALAGPQAYLRWHLTATHSLLGTAAVAAAVSGVFAVAARQSVRLGRALLVCWLAAAAHVALDMTNSVGVALSWPFSPRRFAADLLAPVDLWLVVALVLLLGVPWIFQLASAEIGEKRQGGVSRVAAITLALVAAYSGARATLHARALSLIGAQLFHGEAPLRVAAFPEGTNPFAWSGVVATRDTLQEARVPTAFGAAFSSESARIFPKPPESPVLEAARSAPSSSEFLRYARFPRAVEERTETGYRVALYDLRFDRDRSGRGGIFLEIELDERAQVIHEQMLWGSPLER